MPRKIERYGWVPQLPDARDLRFIPDESVRAALPPSVDLRPLMPPIWDQQQLGSCTANAISAAFEYELKRVSIAEFQPSRLFLYFNERAMEGTIPYDAGAMIRDGVKSVAQQGLCPESEWPYDITQFASQPPAACYADALANKAIVYMAVAQDESHIETALASGYPCIIGFSVFDSFESDQVARTGRVPMPGPNEGVIGGHAVLVVGFHRGTRTFIVRNSWGSGWGDQGYCYFNYDYFLNQNLSSDLWIIKRVS